MQQTALRGQCAPWSPAGTRRAPPGAPGQQRQHRCANAARRAPPPCRAAPKDSEPDLIEKAVSFFFPKALSDPAPMGMKRIDFGALPDQKVDTERDAPLLPGECGAGPHPRVASAAPAPREAVRPPARHDRMLPGSLLSPALPVLSMCRPCTGPCRGRGRRGAGTAAAVGHAAGGRGSQVGCSRLAEGERPRPVAAARRSACCCQTCAGHLPLCGALSLQTAPAAAARIPGSPAA